MKLSEHVLLVYMMITHFCIYIIMWNNLHKGMFLLLLLIYTIDIEKEDGHFTMI